MNTSVGQGAAIIHISQFLLLQEVDIQKVCLLSGISLEKLDKVSLAELDSFWKFALEESNDTYLGLHIGEDSSFSALGLVGGLIQHSATIQQALENACTYLNLLTSAFSVELQIQATYVDLVFTPSSSCQKLYPTALKHSLDWAMVFALKEYQLLTLKSIQPSLVNFAYPSPSSTDDYQRIFACPIEFDSSNYLIRLDKKVLSQKILLANYGFLQVLENHAQQQIDLSTQSKSFKKIVEQAIWRQNGLMLAQLENIAASLNMSKRSLQRRLKAEKTTFQEILDQIRKNLALDYLQNSKIPIKEISFLLGYNEVSAFSRALKRWTNRAPNSYR